MSNCTPHPGPFFDAPAAALVLPVNCDGDLSKDTAQYKTRFPAAFEDYEKACRRQALQPGGLHTYQLSSGQWIIHFATKKTLRQPARIEYIDAGLKALVEFTLYNALATIAIPALGCGTSGLSWTRVRNSIEQAFDVIPSGTVDVLLCQNG